MRSLVEIDPKRLRKLRDRARISQKQLADEAQVDVGTVSRWERRKVARLSPNTVQRVCSALKCTDEELCSKRELPAVDEPDPSPEKNQLNVRINPACRNALILVAQRYGISQREIIELSPLLFLITAERSLKERADAVRAIREAAERITEISVGIPWFVAPNPKSALELEETAVKERDVHGRTALLEIQALGDELLCPDDRYRDEILPYVDTYLLWEDEPWEEVATPLLRFLSKSLSEAIQAPCDSSVVKWRRDGSIKYEICEEEALEFVGGDRAAAFAIMQGWVSIHEVPKELKALTVSSVLPTYGIEVEMPYGKISDAPLDLRGPFLARRSDWVRSKVEQTYGRELLSKLDKIFTKNAGDAENENPSDVP